jgi:hypothetical protein
MVRIWWLLAVSAGWQRCCAAGCAGLLLACWLLAGLSGAGEPRLALSKLFRRLQVRRFPGYLRCCMHSIPALISALKRRHSRLKVPPKNMRRPAGSQARRNIPAQVLAEQPTNLILPCPLSALRGGVVADRHQQHQSQTGYWLTPYTAYIIGRLYLTNLSITTTR